MKTNNVVNQDSELDEVSQKVKTLGEVIIVRKKRKKVTIKNPFETTQTTQAPLVKNKNILPKVIGGGILLGLITFGIIKAIK